MRFSQQGCKKNATNSTRLPSETNRRLTGAEPCDTRTMLILAIDTALDHCAAAVLDTDAAVMRAQESLPMKRGHAEALMPLIARVMRAADLLFTALDLISVTSVPGSFTCVRVVLSAEHKHTHTTNKPGV